MKYDCLKIDHQLCFPLYAVSHKITKRYKPYLDQIGLTYTQYITMMVLWDKQSINVKDLGHILHLDSGTLTPLLKRMQKKGLVDRHRSENDERSVIITLTKQGEDLQEQAKDIPQQMKQCIPLDDHESKELYDLLYKILDYKEDYEND